MKRILIGLACLGGCLSVSRAAYWQISPHCLCDAQDDPQAVGSPSACLDEDTVECDFVTISDGECNRGAESICPNTATKCEWHVDASGSVKSSCNTGCKIAARLVGGGWTAFDDDFDKFVVALVSCNNSTQVTIQTKCSTACTGVCSDPNPKTLCSFVFDCIDCETP